MEMGVTLGRPGDRAQRTAESGQAFQPLRQGRATATVSPQTQPWLGSSSSSMAGGPSPDEMVRALIASHENERRQVARDLHDVVGQALTAIRLHLDLIRREAGRPAIVSFEAAEAAELVDRTLSQVRDLAFAIRPALLEDLGLVAAARSWVAYQARISGFSARFHADMLVDDPPPEIASACFRALQEAVTNVSRHAAASLVEVSLIASGNELVLTVRDDGVGFEPQITLRNPHQSLGLLGTAERIALVGGGMTIESTRVTGTTFRACFPRLSVEPTEADE